MYIDFYSQKQATVEMKLQIIISLASLFKFHRP
jgi:hypothetical protein